MSREYYAYFTLNSLQFDTTPDAKEFLKDQLTEDDNGLAPAGIYEEGTLQQLRVVDNEPYEAEVQITVQTHDGFLHDAREETERVEAYRQALLDKYSPFIDWVEPV